MDTSLISVIGMVGAAGCVGVGSTLIRENYKEKKAEKEKSDESNEHDENENTAASFPKDSMFIDKNKLAENHIEYINGKYSITLHLTLLNVTFWNKILKKQKKKPKKNFDANAIMNSISGVQLPPCKLNKFNFCVMREDKKTEKYELVKSYEL